MKIVDKDGKRYVFDIIRKKYILFTPEEKVRQEVIHGLINHLQYPKAAISVEKAFKVYDRTKRYDIVIYKNEQPWMLIECKAEKVAINQETFNQAGRYNIELQVPYLFITNGKSNYVVKVDFENKKFNFLEELPSYG